MPSTTEGAWAPGPGRPLLREGSVHVWRADLTSVGDEVGGLLCIQERARAQRMTSARDRELWTRSRGVLRTLLGRYLGTDPRALGFATGAHGKPSLLDLAAGASDAAAITPTVSFNLSHSGELALYALTANCAVGVDVELSRRPIDALAIAARAFGPLEARRLAALDPATRRREFLRTWVRHEAQLKCLGVGVSGAEASGGSRRQWIGQLEMGAVAAGAVAAEVAPHELCCWDWRPQSDSPGG